MSPSSAAASSGDNWAVLACTSSYWFNYRHLSNILSLYFIIRRLGIPDDRIVLMNALDAPCDARNPFPGAMFNRVDRAHALGGGGGLWQQQLAQRNASAGHGSDDGDNDLPVEVDYRGEEVGVESFLRLLSGRHTAGR